jgi:predicted metal-binding membrane protein
VRATSTIETLLRRDRLVVIAALVTVIVVCWAYVLVGAGMGTSPLETIVLPGALGVGQTSDAPPGGDMPRTGQSDMPQMDMPGMGHGDMPGMDHGGTAGMDEMPGMAMGEGAADDTLDLAGMAMAPAVWTPGYAGLMFFMWWIMMMAMMLPSAAPMILLFAVINRKQRDKGVPYVPTGIFAAGYLLVWGAFSLVAVSTQWGLERSGLLSSTMASTSVLLGATLLIAAGVYQLTPLKHACLRHCRSPFAFIVQHWRLGDLGALRMGIEHGAFCAGCCWFLMALLFYGGIMNLYWIIGLALYVLLEKTIPAGHWLGRLAGILLIAWGGALMLVVVP